jgi:hypothetical protein
LKPITNETLGNEEEEAKHGMASRKEPVNSSLNFTLGKPPVSSLWKDTNIGIL